MPKVAAFHSINERTNRQTNEYTTTIVVVLWDVTFPRNNGSAAQVVIDSVSTARTFDVRNVHHFEATRDIGFSSLWPI